eukprot:TRINITY_DN2691_c0_g1_i1.p1 TRINITY_DN2691_c0_g1~~TRINITY_DN2691_c0_g1_i1.p1  ORF type:complete len:706 (-),score=239.45 TRINITY_DN2691_c0_g1_i1:161-2278(-)
MSDISDRQTILPSRPGGAFSVVKSGEFRKRPASDEASTSEPTSEHKRPRLEPEAKDSWFGRISTPVKKFFSSFLSPAPAESKRVKRRPKRRPLMESPSRSRQLAGAEPALPDEFAQQPLHADDDAPLAASALASARPAALGGARQHSSSSISTYEHATESSGSQDPPIEPPRAASLYPPLDHEGFLANSTYVPQGRGYQRGPPSLSPASSFGYDAAPLFDARHALPSSADLWPPSRSTYLDEQESRADRVALDSSLDVYAGQSLTQLSSSRFDASSSLRSSAPPSSGRPFGGGSSSMALADTLTASILRSSRLQQPASTMHAPRQAAAESPVWPAVRSAPRRGEIDYDFQQALEQELRQAKLAQERTHELHLGLTMARPVDLTADDDESQAEAETDRRFSSAHATHSDMAQLQRQMKELLRPSAVDETRQRKFEFESESSRRQSAAQRRLLDELIADHKRRQQQLTDQIKKRMEKPKELYPALTSEELAIADAALAKGSVADVIADAFNLRLTREDMWRLRDGQWLNDEVINFYMTLLSENSKAAAGDLPRVYCFNTFFYSMLAKHGHSRVAKWTRKVNLFEYDKLIIPIHKDVHWTLGVINFKDKRFEYLDSMYSRFDSCFQVMRKYLQDEAKAKSYKDLDLSQWTNHSPSDVPQQQNGYDCGVFMCRFAANISQNQPFTFGQKHMLNLRKRMALDICTKQFSL